MVMQLSFNQVHPQLSHYFKELFSAIAPEQSENVPMHCLQLVQDESLWRSIAEQSPESPLISDALKSEHPHLRVFYVLTRSLIGQLLPCKELQRSHSEFLRQFHLWLIKSWLYQFAENNYFVEFQSVFDFTLRIFKPYDRHAGRTFDKQVDVFRQLFQHSTLQLMSGTNFEQLYNGLIEACQEFQKHAQLFERRVVQSELQLANNRRAMRDAERILNNVVAGRSLPYWAHDFVMEHWQRYFQLQLLKTAENKSISSAEVLLQDLLASLKTPSGNRFVRFQESDLQLLRKNIRSLLVETVVEQSSMNQFMRQLKTYHDGLLAGNLSPQEWIKVEGKNVTALEISDPDAVQSSDRTAKVEAASMNRPSDEFDERSVMALCKPGTWLSINKDGEWLRCRVAHRDMQQQLVILVNYSGAKVAVLDTTQLAEAFRQQSFQLIDLVSPLDQAVAKLSDYLQAQQQTLKSQNLAKQRQQQEQLRLKQQAEQKEQQAIARQRRQEKLQQVRSLVEMLTPGAMFQWLQGECQLIRFTLRLKLSGKLVFTDRRGDKFAEWDVDEIAELWTDGVMELKSSNELTHTDLEQIVAVQRIRKQSV